MSKTGDKALIAFAYLTFDNGVKQTYMEPFKPLARSCISTGSTATERSISPVPNGLNVCTKKTNAVEAIEKAAAAIANREYDCRESERFDWMMQMKSKGEYCKIRANKLKWQFLEQQDQGKSEQMLKETREQRKFAKKICEYYQMQYRQLKMEL